MQRILFVLFVLICTSAAVDNEGLKKLQDAQKRWQASTGNDVRFMQEGLAAGDASEVNAEDAIDRAETAATADEGDKFLVDSVTGVVGALANPVMDMMGVPEDSTARKVVDAVSDPVGTLANGAMDMMGVPEDSPARKVVDAVTDPVGTLANGAMDLAGVPEDSPLRTAADVAGAVGCFPAGTEVTMADMTTKSIESLVIGDLTLGGEVTAVMQFSGKGNPLYDYNGVLVAYSHKVLEDGQFIAVSESKVAQLTKFETNVVYDISTTHHRIHIASVTFADFTEVDKLIQVENLEVDELNDNQ